MTKNLEDNENLDEFENDSMSSNDDMIDSTGYKTRTAKDIREKQNLPEGSISEVFKPQQNGESSNNLFNKANIRVQNPSDKMRSVRIPKGSNDPTDIRKRAVSQTGLVVYISADPSENQVELAKQLIDLASHVKEFVLEKMPNAEIRSIITTPKRTQGYNNYNSFGHIVNIGHKFLEQSFTQVPEVKINMFRKEVFVNGKNKKLTSREFSLLSFLVESTGKPISRKKLLKLVWGASEVDNNSRTVDVHIRRLRKKLGDDVIIQTIRRSGYQFDVRNKVVFVNEPGFD